MRNFTDINKETGLPTDKSYLEKDLPDTLEDALNEMKKREDIKPKTL